MSERIVPTSPGWWWRKQRWGAAWCVFVQEHRGELRWAWGVGVVHAVADDGMWVAPVATPEQVAALIAERDDLAAMLAARGGVTGSAGECIVCDGEGCDVCSVDVVDVPDDVCEFCRGHGCATCHETGGRP